jgi:signal transduction histidine kinase
LKAAQDRLVQTEKLASLGQLTAGIAHEIKNPLNFVNNFSAVSVELIDELRKALGGVHLDSKLRAEIGEIADMLQGNSQWPCSSAWNHSDFLTVRPEHWRDVVSSTKCFAQHARGRMRATVFIRPAAR